jgi:trk system potassium uptake protein TrkH
VSSTAPSERRLRPAQAVVLAFGSVAIIGTILLLIPASTVEGQRTDFVTALFTAVSAVSITGLTVVETATHWTFFGHLIILILIQLGGLGIISFASLVGLLISGRLSLRDRLNTLGEARVSGFNNVPSLLRTILLIYVGFEIVMSIYLTTVFYFGHDKEFLQALWYGIFHAISSFNNGGFSLFEGSFSAYSSDFFVIAPVGIAVIVGGLGFPVLIELHERLMRWFYNRGDRPRKLSLHSRITLITTAILLTVGSLFIGILEWSNDETLGDLNVFERIYNAIFASAMTRSGGLNSVDVAEMESATWLGMNFLMFVGGGSGSTAGGIKVTTIAILFFIIWTEIRGETAVNVADRRLPRSIQRQALTLISLSTFTILLSTIAIVSGTGMQTDRVLFDVVSATATVGLSTGAVQEFPAWAQLWMTVLMFVGRLGPVVVASALALRITQRHYELPKERPLIG